MDLLSQELTHINSESCKYTHLNEPLKYSSIKFIDFKYLWVETSNLFTKLQYLCGGIVFDSPNTATVESEFSTVFWENSEYRHSLADFLV